MGPNEITECQVLLRGLSPAERSSARANCQQKNYPPRASHLADLYATGTAGDAPSHHQSGGWAQGRRPSDVPGVRRGHCGLLGLVGRKTAVLPCSEIAWSHEVWCGDGRWWTGNDRSLPATRHLQPPRASGAPPTAKPGPLNFPETPDKKIWSGREASVMQGALRDGHTTAPRGRR